MQIPKEMVWAMGSSRRPSGPRRQKWALSSASPLLCQPSPLLALSSHKCTLNTCLCTGSRNKICSAITYQSSDLHCTGSSKIHIN